MSSSSEELLLSDEDFPPFENVPAAQFHAHIVKLSGLVEEGDITGLDQEFERLENMSLRARLGEEFESAVDLSNKSKNRYANVLPPERTRVKLRVINGGTDYINANYIGSPSGSRTYIASQGPLKHTVNDFWRMVWEESCDTIVMLTRIRENGRHKCHEYWPTLETTYENFSVELIATEGDEELVERTFLMRDLTSSEERTIAHFQYAEWPDHGLPSCTDKFREMLRQVDLRHQRPGPIVVHCSAGIGRTGTFCVVHSVLRELKQKGMDRCTINLPETVLRLRKERTGMVQTRDQYEFCYLAIQEEIERSQNSASLTAE